MLGFTSGQKVVFDIMWSPHCATVFGAVREGKVEIWDLRVNRYDLALYSITFIVLNNNNFNIIFGAQSFYPAIYSALHFV